MLFEFHQWQNAMKPGTVHATYLIHGVLIPEVPLPKIQVDGDVEMTTDAPDQAQELETIQTTTLSLVGEENLKSV
jgi:DNA polymerase delta subunit 3